MKIKSIQALLAAAAVLALLSAGGAQAATLLTDGSFESPDIGAGAYTYPGLPFGTIPPIGATQGGWTFNGAALVNATGGNAWYSGSGPAGKDGVQFVSLQGTSSITQSFTADAATDHLSWLSAGRTNFGCCNGDQSYNITLDGVAVGSAFSTVSNSNFSLNSLDLTGLTVGQTYTLGFQGLIGADESAFLDNVILSKDLLPPPPAAPTITLLTNMGGTDPGVPGGQHTVVDFDNPNAPGFTFEGGFVRSGALGLWPGVSAPPPGDLSNYETTAIGDVGVFTSPYLLKDFSFFLGSPDSYNRIEFLGPGFDWVLNGTAIWGGNPPGDGNQSVGGRVVYDFGDNRVNRILFSSNGNSFEFDTLAASGGIGVPEPATWGLMIVGFGAMGAVLRRRRPVAA